MPKRAALLPVIEPNHNFKGSKVHTIKSPLNVFIGPKVLNASRNLINYRPQVPPEYELISQKFCFRLKILLYCGVPDPPCLSKISVILVSIMLTLVNQSV